MHLLLWIWQFSTLVFLRDVPPQGTVSPTLTSLLELHRLLGKSAMHSASRDLVGPTGPLAPKPRNRRTWSVRGRASGTCFKWSPTFSLKADLPTPILVQFLAALNTFGHLESFNLRLSSSFLSDISPNYFHWVGNKIHFVMIIWLRYSWFSIMLRLKALTRAQKRFFFSIFQPSQNQQIMAYDAEWFWPKTLLIVNMSPNSNMPKRQK